MNTTFGDNFALINQSQSIVVEYSPLLQFNNTHTHCVPIETRP